MGLTPTAQVSWWLASVAEVLPLSHRAARPYSLGEAVAELGAYAQAIGVSQWNSAMCNKNRASLRAEIEAQIDVVGERLGALIFPILDALREDSDPTAVSSSAAQFAEAWHSKLAIAEAFRDLCDAAKVPGLTSGALRKRSAIVASQIGPAARRDFSLLRYAADALVETEPALARRRDSELPSPFTEPERLQMATEILVSPPAGQVVVWMVYRRATIYGVRESAASMTFLRPEWALPNAYDVALNDFPERAELRRIRKDVHWMDELHEESLKSENRLVLVRVDLGERQLAGALEEARRRVEAVLSLDPPMSLRRVASA